MNRKEKLENYCLIVLLLNGVVAVIWAISGFPVKSIGSGLFALSAVTIFFSSFFRIQLPRTNIHLTISDSMIILSLLLYGGEIAVILVALETTFTSLNFRRQGVRIKPATVLINVLIAVAAVFAAVGLVRLIFGSPQSVLESGDTTTLIWLLSVTALSLFIVNSLGTSAIVALRSEKSVLSVWNEHCINALVIYLSGAVLAGVTAVALRQVNVFLFVAVVALFWLIFFTYRRYIEDIKQTAAIAELSERRRAEQAEAHVQELQHYVSELEKSGRALHESREKFRHAAYHDALTGLPNRAYFIDTLEMLLDKSSAGAASNFAVLFLDLNRFKKINDSLGHSAGDSLIRQVAGRLVEMVGPGGLVGRFGGDEFAILLTNIRDRQVVARFADDVVRNIARPYAISGQYIFASVSIGIAFDSAKYSEGEEVVRDADIAMYYAKEQQKNYVIFDQNMHAQAVSMLELENDLRNAIERNELELYYQPIVALNGMKLAGFEALVRWNHPTRGLVAPDDFISLSEDTGLIVPMTIQILHKACRQLYYWQNHSSEFRHLTINVNMSGKQFTEGDLVGEVKSVIAETGIDPRYLKLEITESAVMENAEHAISMLSQIKATGVRLSIDDFGTGYSSLSYLHRFPIDTLKIDRSFVSTMDNGSENGEIVKAIIALASALDLSVIAEGIESIGQLHQLRVLGCEYGQGYLFSRPHPVSEIERMLCDQSIWYNLSADPGASVVPVDAGYSSQLPA